MLSLFVVGVLGACSSSYGPESGEPEDEGCSCLVDTYGYDGELLTSIVETYDAAGHKVGEQGTTSAGFTYDYTWVFDGDLLVEFVARGADDVIAEVIRYDHDDQGRFVLVSYDEGFRAGIQIELDYDDVGLTDSRRFLPDGLLISESLFHRDASGRSLGWEGFSEGELVTSGVLTYEAPSPSLDHTEVATSNNQDPQSTHRLYGPQGELIEEVEVSSVGSETFWSFDHDAEGRVSIVFYDDGSNPTFVTYTYDAAGREVLRDSVPTPVASQGQPSYGGRIEREWLCRDQPALATPTVPGIVTVLVNHPLLGRF